MGSTFFIVGKESFYHQVPQFPRALEPLRPNDSQEVRLLEEIFFAFSFFVDFSSTVISRSRCP